MTINLPDYCPDIQKILKCQMYPRITGRGITGDRLELDGNCLVKVFYLDAEGVTVRCCENTESFSVAIQLKKPADNGCISACLLYTSENTALLVVCDGMGGANGGSTASRMAVDTVCAVLCGKLHESMDPDSVKELLLKAVEEANTAVYRLSLTEPELSGMGTTVVAAVLQEEAAYIVHVGDSRAYHCLLYTSRCV